MFYVSNSANAILASGYEKLNDAGEFGYRFQAFVVEALKRHIGFADLYDNRGAGQPDCYANQKSYAFEIKARGTDVIALDDNSWKSLPTYENPRLVAMLTTGAPFPMWVIDLKGRSGGSVQLARESIVDEKLEATLTDLLSDLIESVGSGGLVLPSRSDFILRVESAAKQLDVSPHL